jgi:two-component system response regulator HydG
MSNVRILIVDDEPEVLRVTQRLLETKGYGVDTAASGAQALAILSQRPAALLITDFRMPNWDGIELLTKIRELHPQLPSIAMTAADDVSSAVQAMRAGIDDYLCKPVNVAALLFAVERSLGRSGQTDAENPRSELRAREQDGPEGLLGTSVAMRRVYRMARQAARARAAVLITGESGTGKGRVARAIQALSSRKSAPFVSIHCAALAESSIESGLAGIESGIVTGAVQGFLSCFAQADGGTLFLDEVAEISSAVQLKLLQLLQKSTPERARGNDAVSVDVRVIAATSKDLLREVREGRFREELYYRLSVVQIDLPPLKFRGNDVMLLAEYFMRKFSGESQRSIDGFSDEARAKLLSHGWPGNVRELENAIERAVVFSEGSTVQADALPFDSISPYFEGIGVPGAPLAEIERYAIMKTLEAVGGSTVRAAHMLDISVRTIQYRLNEYGSAVAAKSRH